MEASKTTCRLNVIVYAVAGVGSRKGWVGLVSGGGVCGQQYSAQFRITGSELQGGFHVVKAVVDCAKLDFRLSEDAEGVGVLGYRGENGVRFSSGFLVLVITEQRFGETEMR